MKTSLVLMAHGSRQAAANDDLIALAEMMQARGPYDRVAPSFLELAEPGILTACRDVVHDGAERVVMVPYFLSAGVHVRRDLTALRDQLATEFPSVAFELAEPLGRHPLLMDIVLQRAAEALG